MGKKIATIIIFIGIGLVFLCLLDILNGTVSLFSCLCSLLILIVGVELRTKVKKRLVETEAGNDEVQQ